MRRAARGLPLLAVATCSLTLGLTQPASATGLRPPGQPLTILNPVERALKQGKFVRVSVRVRKGVSLSSATVGGNPVRLRKSSKRVLTARIRSHRLGPGPALFDVHARTADGRDVRRTAHFTVAGKRSRRLLSATVRGSGGGPMRVRTRLLDRHALVRAWLNGGRVHDLFGRHGTRRNASLSASDGLRFGRNVLRVTAFLPDGTYDTVKRTQFRSRRLPLAGAGRDKAVPAGHALKLDGRASRLARRATHLSFSWKLVRRPPGSKAKLRRVHSRRPGLRPDRTGVYRVRLTVHGGQAGRKGAAKASAAGGSSDTVTITAQPDAPPIGVPIDTYQVVSGTPQIEIAGQAYTTFPAAPASGYGVLVLDRAGPQGGSLEVVKQAAVLPGNEADILNLFTAGDSTEMVVITALPGTQIDDPTGWNNVMAAIGGEAINSNEAVSAGFSIVGIPGQNSGQAWEYTAPISGSGASKFNGIEGYLSQDAGPDGAGDGYVLTPSDYVPFDLGPASGAASQTQEMVIGDCGPQPQTPYCVQIPMPNSVASPGFVMAAVDAYDLHLRVGPVSFTDDDSGMQSLGEDLQGIAQDPSLIVLLKSVGEPVPEGPGWFDASRGIDAAGGNPQIFNTLNTPNQAGTADYALVGGGGGFQAKQTWGTNPNGAFGMTGVLTREGDWRLSPMLSDQTNGDVPYDIPEVAYQPAYQWPSDPSQNFPFRGGVYAAAEADIAQQILCPPNPNRTQPCPAVSDIRQGYWQAGNVQWNTDLLDNVKPQSGPYTPQQFYELVNQLKQEWTDVNAVNDLMGKLVTPDVAASGEQAVDVQDITNSIQMAMNPPQSNVTAEIFEILAGVAAAASAVLAPEFAAPVAAAVIGAMGGGFSIAGALTTDGDGNRILQELQTDSLNLQTQLQNAVVTQGVIGTERVREMLVSDWGKLQAAANLENEVLPQQGDAPSLTIGNEMLQLTARRQAYHALFPVVGTAKHPSGGTGDLGSAQLDCVTGIEPGPNVTLDTTKMWIFFPGDLGFFTDTNVTDPIFATPFGSNDNGTQAGEDVADYWDTLWPNVGSVPCGPTG
jgi:hypothetical protein